MLYIKIVVEGIFSNQERELHQTKQAQRHTKTYIQQHTTKLQICNRENKSNTQKYLPETNNPILMIGEIHAERVNSIEEMIKRKRDIKEDPERKATKTNTGKTIMDNLERLQVFLENDRGPG